MKLQNIQLKYIYKMGLTMSSNRMADFHALLLQRLVYGYLSQYIFILSNIMNLRQGAL